MPITVEKTAEAKKTNVAATIIHIGPPEDFKVFQKGEEVKGISKDEMEALKKQGDVKEM